MTTITPSARHVPGAAIKDGIIRHPVVAFFMLAFAGTWRGIPLIAFGVSAALILVATRGRLSYHPDRAA